METRFCVGSKVRMKENVAHIALPEFYPNCTVIGEVLGVRENMFLVDWDEDSGILSKPEGLVDKDLVTKVEE